MRQQPQPQPQQHQLLPPNSLQTPRRRWRRRRRSSERRFQPGMFHQFVPFSLFLVIHQASSFHPLLPLTMILIQRKQKKAERKAAKLAAKRKAEEEAKKAEAMEETSDEQVWWSSMSVQDDCIILSTTLQPVPILVFTTNQNYPTGWRVCWRDCRDLKRNQPDSQTILKWRNWFGTKPGKRNRLETRNWSQRTKPGIDLLIFWPGSRNRLHTAPNGRRGNKN